MNQKEQKIEDDKKAALDAIAAREEACRQKEDDSAQREGDVERREKANADENARLAKIRENLNNRARAIAQAAGLEE